MDQAATMTGPRSARPGRLKQAVSILVVLLVLVLIWEGYKSIWLQMGWIRPVRPDATTMPHVWDMFIELFRRVRRGGDLLILDLAARSLFTLREAFAGFVIGGMFGFGLSVLFVRSLMLERAFKPYVISHTCL
jgi:ABC-type nitrate/sulfonate/bicarbonate transport system permease component